MTTKESLSDDQIIIIRQVFSSKPLDELLEIDKILSECSCRTNLPDIIKTLIFEKSILNSGAANVIS